MSAPDTKFKAQTLRAEDTIRDAKGMRAVSDEFARGFSTAMREAREIYMRLTDSGAHVVVKEVGVPAPGKELLG